MRRETNKKINYAAIQITKRLTNTPLAMCPNTLYAILNIVSSRIAAAHLSVPDKKNTPHFPQRNGLVLHGSIAAISINDFLNHHSDLITECLLGGTSYETIRAQFLCALHNPNVSAIIFDVDSAGGDVSGCFDLVDDIYNARGIKPVYAVVNEMAYAGAYAIASAANKVYIPRTGSVGSIGVVYLHADQSKFDEKIGVKFTSIFAGAHKNDFTPHAPLSPENLQTAQSIVTSQHELFIKTVARNRGISPQAVRDTQAGLYYGQNAIDAGLADSVMPFSKVLDDLKKTASANKISRLMKGS